MPKASAPGKVHLIGEHAIVYGEPAILAAVGLRTTVSAERSEKIKCMDTAFPEKISCSIEDAKRDYRKATDLWKSGFEKKDFAELLRFVKSAQMFKKIALALILEEIQAEGGSEVKINSELPIGSGIGSSAALSVAMTKAISEVYGKKLTKDEINNIAFKIEQIAHGTPSGGDNSTCCYGGLVWFQRGNPNTIKSLKKEIPHKLENFVLVYTKPPEKNTGELVQMVRNLPEEFRNERMKKIGSMVHEMKDALKRKDSGKIKLLINRTQQNLAELGVSVPEIDEIASSVKVIGGAAKLCGAGGGGMMLCYHENKTLLRETIRVLGYNPIEVDLAVEGVRSE